MPIKRINEFPEGSGYLSNDDVFLFMDDPSGSGITKKISLSEISSSIGGGGPVVISVGSVGGSINTDASSGDIFDINLTGSGLLVNPTNGVDGQSVRWRITYAANSLALSLDTEFNIPSSASSPLPLSTTSGTTDLLAATYDSGRNQWDVIAFVPGY
jgi:hypothetical protein